MKYFTRGVAQLQWANNPSSRTAEFLIANCYIMYLEGRYAVYSSNKCTAFITWMIIHVEKDTSSKISSEASSIVILFSDLWSELRQWWLSDCRSNQNAQSSPEGECEKILLLKQSKGAQNAQSSPEGECEKISGALGVASMPQELQPSRRLKNVDQSWSRKNNWEEDKRC